MGDHVTGLLKSAGAGRDPAPPVAMGDGEASLLELATAVGAALGLDVFGVDVLIGPDGPQIVDVNPFPGLRGVPGAALQLASHLRALAQMDSPRS